MLELSLRKLLSSASLLVVLVVPLVLPVQLVLQLGLQLGLVVLLQLGLRVPQLELELILKPRSSRSIAPAKRLGTNHG